MITRNAMQLKALIKQKAAAKKISAQLVMQNYMLERLLDRISHSDYKHNLIIKGGFLISAIVGLDSRATMDLDTTIKGFTLTHASINQIFREICAIQLPDDIQFELLRVSDIREGDDYPGLRVALQATYTKLCIPLTVDVTTGDIITPRAITYRFPSLFDESPIPALAYPIETILAEKIETVLSRSIANTRPRDFYDIHILYTLHPSDCRTNILREALNRTIEKRSSHTILQHPFEILETIRTSETLQNFWKRYQQSAPYAQDISFSDTVGTLQHLLTLITAQ